MFRLVWDFDLVLCKVDWMPLVFSGGSAITSGRITVKSEPFPMTEAALISPPIAYARFLLIVRPRPTPSLLSSLFFMILVNAEKRDCIR